MEKDNLFNIETESQVTTWNSHMFEIACEDGAGQSETGTKWQWR